MAVIQKKNLILQKTDKVDLTIWEMKAKQEMQHKILIYGKQDLELRRKLNKHTTMLSGFCTIATHSNNELRDTCFHLA